MYFTGWPVEQIDSVDSDRIISLPADIKVVLLEQESQSQLHLNHPKSC